jgi:hypothetical protein
MHKIPANERLTAEDKVRKVSRTLKSSFSYLPFG